MVRIQSKLDLLEMMPPNALSHLLLEDPIRNLDPSMIVTKSTLAIQHKVILPSAFLTYLKTTVWIACMIWRNYGDMLSNN
jgi:hypothetical protein